MVKRYSTKKLHIVSDAQYHEWCSAENLVKINWVTPAK